MQCLLLVLIDSSNVNRKLNYKQIKAKITSNILTKKKKI